MANLSAIPSSARELAQLRDIHLPKPIGWWPLAPGWYWLAVLILMLFMTGIFFITRHYINGRAKRQALHLLASYQYQYQRDLNAPSTAARLSELLKRVALVYFPRTKVASLQGEEWIAFLNSTSKGLDFEKVRTELLDMPYQPSLSNDLNLFIKMVRNWIKQRRGRCLN